MDPAWGTPGYPMVPGVQGPRESMGEGSLDALAVWIDNPRATARIGAIMVCLNPAYRPDELAFAINNVSVKYLVMAQSFKQSNYVAMLKELAPEIDSQDKNTPRRPLTLSKLPSLKYVYTIGDKPVEGLQAFSALQKP